MNQWKFLQSSGEKATGGLTYDGRTQSLQTKFRSVITSMVFKDKYYVLRHYRRDKDNKLQEEKLRSLRLDPLLRWVRPGITICSTLSASGSEY